MYTQGLIIYIRNISKQKYYKYVHTIKYHLQAVSYIIIAAILGDAQPPLDWYTLKNEQQFIKA